MKDLGNEVWKPVVGYEGFYEVSDCGRVRSVEHVIIRKNGATRPIRSKFIHVTTMPNRYLQVMLYKDKKHKHAYIHRLVAEAFIPNPMNLTEINHKDENQQNNHADNLEWCDRKYNVNYGTAKDRMIATQIENGYGSKTVLQYDLSGKFIKEYPSIAEAARSVGTRQNYISKCCSGYSTYTQVKGFQWKLKGSDKAIRNILPIVQYDMQGNEIARFESVADASRKLGIPTDGILACISGEYIQSHGFVWKREGLIRVRPEGHKKGRSE